MNELPDDADALDLATPADACCARPNYWTEREAAGDIELPRCVHGVPRNVYCGRCES